MPKTKKGNSSLKKIYRIFATNQFLDDISKLMPHREALIENKLQEIIYPQLKKNPFYGPHIKRLKNLSPPTWRFRIGEWRFFYEIDKVTGIVYLTTASHRKDSYR